VGEGILRLDFVIPPLVDPNFIIKWIIQLGRIL
jgi:hypothetical protein